ncbi:MAG: hypothetical protein JW997_03130, partial [Actinobacteria bacterium]|nr:hypothetical protein [Actinomycetota bacterium]
MDKNSKRIIASKKIVFAVPGSKVYISSFYKNRPKSFLNISLTGNRCSLMCTHCRGKLLESMASADGVDLYKIIENESANGLEGVLISGGFNDMGVLEMEGRYKQIKAVKDHFPDLKVLIHAGFVSRQMAHSLAKTGCDGVLLNVTGSSDAIENVYNLKGFKPQHYFNSLINLKESGLKTAPHIVVGLGNTHNNHDMEALKNILEIGADWLVLVSVVNLFYTAGRAHKNYLADASSSNKSTGPKKDFKNK